MTEEAKQRAGIEAAADADALLALPTVMALTGMARSTVYECVKRGDFPPQARRTRRFARWRAGDVRAWLRNEWTPANSEAVEVAA
jgi:prophage regulatory protein